MAASRDQHTYGMSNNPNTLFPFLATCTNAHVRTGMHRHALTSQDFRCPQVLCRLYTQFLCRRLWVFSAMQTGVVGVPVAVVPMETGLVRTQSCVGTCWWLQCKMKLNDNYRDTGSTPGQYFQNTIWRRQFHQAEVDSSITISRLDVTASIRLFLFADNKDSMIITKVYVLP